MVQDKSGSGFWNLPGKILSTLKEQARMLSKLDRNEDEEENDGEEDAWIFEKEYRQKGKECSKCFPVF
ncbi:MAG: hypothetical protein GY795_13025 [Desulfobacterales bacterium]|nr:hypothetical protein [Desulfobacterales bacterium]